MFHGNRGHGRRVALASAVLLTLGLASAPATFAEELNEITTIAMQASVQILSTTVVDYEARVLSATDAINTQPWGTPGFETIGWSADYTGKTVAVTQ